MAGPSIEAVREDFDPKTIWAGSTGWRFVRGRVYVGFGVGN